MTAGRPFPLFVLGALSFIGTSCASVPGTPGGPLQRAGVVQISETQQLYDVSLVHVTSTAGSEKGFHSDAGTTLVFPDFLLRHRIHPERRVLVELAGF